MPVYNRQIVPYHHPTQLARRAGGGVARRVAGRVARYVPYVGPALDIAQGIYEGGKYLYNSMPKRSKTSKKMITGSAPKSSAGYGAFKSTTYQGKMKKYGYATNSQSKVLAQGAKKVVEKYGLVTGFQAVYLMTSTFDIDQICETIAIAVLRKLFAKSGQDICDADAILRANNDKDGVGFAIIRQVWNETSKLYVHGEYKTVNGETLVSLASNCGLQNEIKNYITSNTDEYSVSIDLCLHQQGQFVRTISTLNLKNQLIHLNMFNKLTIGNITRGFNGDTSAESVDAQPLKGKLYTFNGAPRTKVLPGFPEMNSAVNRESLFTVVPTNNIKLISSDTPGFPFDFQKPPQPNYFSNCKSANSIRMEPGTQKDVSISNKFDMYYATLLLKFRGYMNKTNTVGAGLKTVLIGLEENLNTGSSDHPVAVRYETTFSVGCRLTQGRPPSYKVRLATVQV